MAYLIDCGGGGKITLKAAVIVRGGRKRKVALGRVQAEIGRRFCDKLEELAATRDLNETPKAAVAQWVSGLNDGIRERLAEIGLIDAPTPVSRVTLAEMLVEVFKGLQVRDQTRVTYSQTRTSLEACFGAATPVRSITSHDAERFRRWLVEQELAEATISKRVKTARAFFRVGLRWKMVSENVFEGIRAGGQSNRDRMAFVPADDVAKVIDEANTTEWKALIALARFAGLRCPSEHFALRWEDIDWAKQKMVVHSPKTSGKEGREYRVVPIFAEVLPFLTRLYTEAPEGTEYVFNTLRRPRVNLRTQFERFVKRAGLVAWPKLFQNLRSSRATELVGPFQSHVVASWLGHTEAVAREHYLQVLDSDFAAATSLPDSLSRGRNRVPATGDSAGQAGSADGAAFPQVPELQQGVLVGTPCHSKQVTPRGFEQIADSGRKQCDSGSEGANAGTCRGDIAELVAMWGRLPAGTRAEILRLAGITHP